MSVSRLPVAITMRRTPLANRWVSERWDPVSVEPRVDVDAAVPVIAAGPDTWTFLEHALELHPSEAEGYHLNLTAPDPKAFVMWRMAEPEALRPDVPAARPHVITVSYNEAARMLDGGEQVDAVPLSPVIRAWMEPFVAQHYKPEPKRKVRRRDPLRDDVDNRAAPGGRSGTQANGGE